MAYGQRRRRGRGWGALFALLVASGCASIPKGQYGVTDIDWVGVEEMSEEAIEACLVTREREQSTLRLGLGAGKCGQPPFDASPPKIGLWTWPWVEWPLWDPSIFDLDRERIERWYRARGFYDARVKGVRTYTDGHAVTEPTDCDPEKSSCKVQVAVQVDEGKPVMVSDVRIETSGGGLSTDVLRGVEKQLSVERGQRWDEYGYEQ
ncbi:MAG TPA: hypothetical protein VJR89_40280, partial [Polyangiales bacterium]|nr:hypothetical protein [Polyangiales bacterium]